MDCIFCKILNGEIPSKKIYEDDKVIAILDVNPVVDGHTLIIPKKHVEDYTKLDKDLLIHIYDVANKLTKDIMSKLNSKGMTFTVNYGDSQLVKHFHLHLLPDYQIKDKEMEINEVFEILTK
jgi:histidine triad (HIT) family protein